MSNFQIYIIIVNILGLLLVPTNRALGKSQRHPLDAVLIVMALAGGALGEVLGMLAFDRRATKDGMMARVVALCACVVDALLLFAVNGHLQEHLTFAFWTFFAQHPLVLGYVVVVNIAAMIVYGIDKRMAVAGGGARISVATLIGLAIIGGSIGAWCGMQLFRHKTKKATFALGVPLIFLMQMVVLFCAMNVAW